MSRDDQFAGFAELLYKEFANSGAVYRNGTVTRRELSKAEVERIIARRAYDLMHHAMTELADCALYGDTVEGNVASIPDMRQLPEETKEI
jgi:hypothetical protein